MKNLSNFFLMLTILFWCNAFSQTSTEKWNSLMKRYEYFDSSGYLTGYKEYNSLMGTWDYYSEKQRPRQNQYNPIVNPINENLVRQALALKQARFNSNVQRVKNEKEKMASYVNNLDIDYDTKVIILDRHHKEYTDVLNKKRYDFSDNNLTNQIINFLSEGINKITKEETSK